MDDCEKVGGRKQRLYKMFHYISEFVSSFENHSFFLFFALQMVSVVFAKHFRNGVKMIVYKTKKWNLVVAPKQIN